MVSKAESEAKMCSLNKRFELTGTHNEDIQLSLQKLSANKSQLLVGVPVCVS